MTNRRPEVDVVREFGDASWGGDGPTRGVEAVVEAGHVLSFPRLSFALEASEQRFLDPRWADAKAKNVSLRWPAGELRGALGEPADVASLRRMIVRYAEQSVAFALRLFPRYRGQLRRGNTSFRPVDVAGRARSWRQDDTRLHIDAFPSNPMQGTRLLRVFCNVNPNGEPRRWRVGEPFEAHARRYLASIGRPLPGSSWLLEKIGITKRRRTGYDHLMLQLHDRAKADDEFQRSSPQARIDFAPGTTWVCFSDQVLPRRDGRPAHDGADFPSRRRRPRASRKLAARHPRAARRPPAPRLTTPSPAALRRRFGAGITAARRRQARGAALRPAGLDVALDAAPIHPDRDAALAALARTPQ